MDETWNNDYTSESNRSPVEWTVAIVSRPKRQKKSWWASVFWNVYGTLFILRKAKLLTLEGLSLEIKKKRSNMQKKKMMFHQDNVPRHKLMKTMVNLHEWYIELLFQPLYSLDLAPCGY